MSEATIGQFRHWLRRQTKRDDRVGDFARDFLADDCAADVRTLSGLDRHIVEEHPSGITDAVLESRDLAWREFTLWIAPATWSRRLQ